MTPEQAWEQYDSESMRELAIIVRRMEHENLPAKQAYQEFNEWSIQRIQELIGQIRT